MTSWMLHRVAKLLVNIDVDDLETAANFYQHAFELTIGRRFGLHALELTGADAPIYLLAKGPGSTPFPGASEVRDYERHWTPVHLDFAVDDLEAALLRAERAGAKKESKI